MYVTHTHTERCVLLTLNTLLTKQFVRLKAFFPLRRSQVSLIVVCELTIVST